MRLDCCQRVTGGYYIDAHWARGYVRWVTLARLEVNYGQAALSICRIWILPLSRG